ncbi:XdhC family protein [Shewanella sp. A25]|nr:XdhC family protein [Shewanella shenzhenensis]
MSGLSALYNAIVNNVTADNEAVLATVVKVEGSAYRRPGARMLISQFETEGVISGGCLEPEVIKTAWWHTESGACVRRYHTAEDNEDTDVALNFGLGCNGTVHVLFERIDLKHNCLLIQVISNVVLQNKSAAIATVIVSDKHSGIRIGERIALFSDGSTLGGLAHCALTAGVITDLKKALQEQGSCRCQYTIDDAQLEVFVEYLPPIPRLVICGGGDDAQPLATIAKIQGWHVTVIDGRSHFARVSRFPHADQVITEEMNVEKSRQYNALFHGASVVIMTHSLKQDEYWLNAALSSQACYIGQLGPRTRTEKLLENISARIGPLHSLDRLHYPVGLDLGGDTPESVAIAILGEITAFRHKRTGNSLRYRNETIHTPDPVRQALVVSLQNQD